LAGKNDALNFTVESMEDNLNPQKLAEGKSKEKPQ
jgi:hypothetical protein